MFVTENTIQTHVQHIFQKLGVRSRTELATRLPHRPSKHRGPQRGLQPIRTALSPFARQPLQPSIQALNITDSVISPPAVRTIVGRVCRYGIRHLPNYQESHKPSQQHA